MQRRPLARQMQRRILDVFQERQHELRHRLRQCLQLLRHKLYEVVYFCISNFAPSDFIIFKNEGDDVKTVSKFFIFNLAPVNTAKINVDIHIR